MLALALLISTLMRQFVLQVYSIPSESMTSTLQVGDRIVVSRIPGQAANVERGDVVVFEDSQGWMQQIPQAERGLFRPIGEFLGIIPADGNRIIVKRIIGVGGDTVECCNEQNQLLVNGVPVEETYLQDSFSAAQTEFSVEVPAGHYWVMGDNRANSADSLYHYRHGDNAFIAQEDIIGPAKSVIWPLPRWSLVSHRDAFEEVPNG